jgi:cytoskeleton protein RodZ
MNEGLSMSESTRLEDGTALVGPAGDDRGVTAGTILRQAREAAGLHVATLAVALKVPVRKVEALEEDRLDLLPDAVFIRALASSVCRTLKIDPQPVLERLPQTAVPRLVQDGDGINAPFHTPSDGARPSWLSHLSKPVFLIVFALLLGALVLIFLPLMQQEDKIAAALASTATSGAAGEPAAPPMVAAVQPVQTAGMTSPAASAELVSTSTDITAPVSIETATPLAKSASASALESELVPPAIPASPSGILLFRTRGSSWVEVKDAKGFVAVRKTLATGESAAVSGVLPLQVTIGSVDVTDVQVRGKPFDLRAVSRDNVAHFEVR